MPAPDPEGMSLLTKALVAAAAVVPPIWGARSWLERRFSKKADKDEVEKMETEIKTELTVQRGYFKDVFNQMRENEQRAQDRHERLMEKLITKE